MIETFELPSSGAMHMKQRRHTTTLLYLIKMRINSKFVYSF